MAMFLLLTACMSTIFIYSKALDSVNGIDLANWETARARQSSEGGYGADSILQDGCILVSRTKNEANPWVEIDLGLNAEVYGVTVMPTPTWDTTMRIWLLQDPWESGVKKECGKEQKVKGGQLKPEFICSSNPLARFVVIERNNAGKKKPLSLCEVHIFGAPKSYTDRQTAKQIDTLHNSIEYDARNAVNNDWSDHSCTDKHSRPWWRAELLGTVNLRVIIVKAYNSGNYVVITCGKKGRVITGCNMSHLDLKAGQKHKHNLNQSDVNSVEIKRIDSRKRQLCLMEIKVYGVCASGYFGSKCTQNCPLTKSCAGGCSKESGQCLICKSGFYGKLCVQNCGKGCKNNCDRYNGSCICMPGYMLPDCQSLCRGEECDTILAKSGVTIPDYSDRWECSSPPTGLTFTFVTLAIGLLTIMVAFLVLVRRRGYTCPHYTHIFRKDHNASPRFYLDMQGTNTKLSSAELAEGIYTEISDSNCELSGEKPEDYKRAEETVVRDYHVPPNDVTCSDHGREYVNSEEMTVLADDDFDSKMPYCNTRSIKRNYDGSNETKVSAYYNRHDSHISDDHY